MTIDTQNLLNSILESLERIEYIKAEDIPNIDLYMDQVTTFMDEHLEQSKRYPEDKILTKTMINNYAKNHLLPPPNKKKYSKDHMLLLILIYYFKNILSINDIQKVLTPLNERYFKNEKGMDMSWLYEHIMNWEPAQSDRISSQIQKLSEDADNIFKDAPQDDQEYLQLISVISLLVYDVYQKKQLIEKLIDSIRSHRMVNQEKRKNSFIVQESFSNFPIQ